jgi:hypothetical protein
MLERVVPAEGLQLPDGPFLPAGTIVGANPWIIHRHGIFGENVESFVPERWLRKDAESDASFQTRKQKMLRATFTFGAGPRTCIGKNISLLEIYKLIPSLLLRYKARESFHNLMPFTDKSFQIELDDPNAEWEIVNSWFVRQKNMDVRLTDRKALAEK